MSVIVILLINIFKVMVIYIIMNQFIYDVVFMGKLLSVANGKLLVHSQEQFVTPAVETDRHI